MTGRHIAGGALAALAALALKAMHGAGEATATARAAARDAVEAIHDPDIKPDKALGVAQAYPDNAGGAGKD